MSKEVFDGVTEFDCATCGACCREAYHVVELASDDPFLEEHPNLVTRVEGRAVLERPGGHCVALCNEGSRGFACRVYETRPVSCREFEVGGENCLEARKRVGL